MTSTRHHPFRPAIRVAVVSFALLVLSAWSDAPVRAGGFEKPILVLPETGLWADGFTDLAYGREPGLAILWGLDSLTVARPPGRPAFDWSLVPYQTIVRVYDPTGNKIIDEEKVVDPPRIENGTMTGGFPLIVRGVIRQQGEYSVRLEAYPLMDPSIAGLDSVPRRVIETKAVVSRVRPEQTGWQLSDILILRDIRPWKPGVSRHRTWYEWDFDPAASRIVQADSSGAYVAFELQRGREVVPRCQLTNCRVTVSIYDAEGGLALQTLRPVPGPSAVSAYMVAIETMALEPGEYEANAEVYEGGEKLASERRRFSVRRSGSQ